MRRLTLALVLGRLGRIDPALAAPAVEQLLSRRHGGQNDFARGAMYSAGGQGFGNGRVGLRPLAADLDPDTGIPPFRFQHQI